MTQIYVLIFLWSCSLHAVKAAETPSDSKDESGSPSVTPEQTQIDEYFSFLPDSTPADSRGSPPPQSPGPSERLRSKSVHLHTSTRHDVSLPTTQGTKPKSTSVYHKHMGDKSDVAGPHAPGDVPSRSAQSPVLGSTRVAQRSTAGSGPTHLLHRRVSLFSQCQSVLPEILGGGGSTGVCQSRIDIAEPPRRHPLVSLEYECNPKVPFSPVIPPWHALVSQARTMGLEQTSVPSQRQVSLWNTEVLHRLLWLQTEGVQRALDHLHPSNDAILDLLFHTLDLSEALMYTEGTAEIDSGSQWYLELMEATVLARKVLDDALQTLESIYHPTTPESRRFSQWMFGEATGDWAPLAPGDTGADASPAKIDTADSAGAAAESHASAAEAGAGVSEAPPQQSRRGSVMFGEQAPTTTTEKSRAASGLGERLRRSAVSAVERAVATAAVTPGTSGSANLLSSEDLLTMRIESYRLMDGFESRQQPIKSRRTVEGREQPIKIFRCLLVEATGTYVPYKSKHAKRQRIITALTELLMNVKAVNSTNGARPVCVEVFLVLLTRLSSSLRTLLEMKLDIPALWEDEIQELIGHAFVRLEYLLAQRRTFLKHLPFTIGGVRKRIL